jgi:thioredoxin 1
MNANKSRIAEVSQSNFKSEVMESTRPVLVAFLAPWSRPCHVVQPILDEVTAMYAGTIKIVMINADENPGLGISYEVHSIPTLLYFVDGSERARIVGTASKKAILDQLIPLVPSEALHSKPRPEHDELHHRD